MKGGEKMNRIKGFLKKGLIALAIIVLSSFLWFFFGCGASKTSVTIPVAHEYPQMYSQSVLDIMDDMEEKFNITFLGCYDDTQGALLVWVWDHEKGKCEAAIFYEGASSPTIDCERGWEIYRQVCLEVGNCV
jgi:hypothetical protein